MRLNNIFSYQLTLFHFEKGFAYFKAENDATVEIRKIEDATVNSKVVTEMTLEIFFQLR